MSDTYGLERDHKIRGDGEVALLTTVYDFATLGIVRGLLEEEHIPYLARERRGAAMGLIVGFSMCGTDIFVPESELEQAQGLIAGFTDDGASVEVLPEDDV